MYGLRPTQVRDPIFLSIAWNKFSMNNKSPFPPGSRVIAYLRESGGGEQEQSLEQQTRVMEMFCAQNNLELVGNKS